MWPKGKKPWVSERNRTTPPMLGKKRPEVSERMKNRTGEKHPLWGKHPSEETIKKLRENNPLLGKKNLQLSERNKAHPPWLGKKNPKLSMLLKGRKCPEQSERMKNGGGAYAASFCKNPSEPQVKLFEMVKQLYPSAVLNFVCKKYCLDVAIPELKLAIEYDGEYWHKGREEADKKRQQEIEQDGWKFLRYSKLPSDNILKESLNFQGCV